MDEQEVERAKQTIRKQYHEAKERGDKAGMGKALSEMRTLNERIVTEAFRPGGNPQVFIEERK